MNARSEDIRAAIAEQAAEWFIVNQSGSLTAEESTEFLAWLKASPVHVREYLGVARVARHLPAAIGQPEVPLETFLKQTVPPLPRVAVPTSDLPARRWLRAAAVMAALAVVSLALLWLWNLRPVAPVSTPAPVAALHFETRHGEQQTYRLADNSLVHLNTESAITIRYSSTERLAVLTAGEAEFEITHEPGRAFRVLAGTAEVVDLGTSFDVRLEPRSTLVTVVEGRVAVGLATNAAGAGTAVAPKDLAGFVQLGANQQLRVSEEGGPGTPQTVDAEEATSWLHRQISFDHEPLERVAAEFNRYAPKPIEIATPTLRSLKVSGVFATDDTKAFVAFLRTLPGVQVEETATRIRVSQK